MTQTDGTVNFTWGGNSPGSQVSSDNFSVKWSGQVRAPVSGSYTFTVTGDDGVRLFLNGQLVIDGWVAMRVAACAGAIPINRFKLFRRLSYSQHLPPLQAPVCVDSITTITRVALIR